MFVGFAPGFCIPYIHGLTPCEGGKFVFLYIFAKSPGSRLVGQAAFVCSDWSPAIRFPIPLARLCVVKAHFENFLHF